MLKMFPVQDKYMACWINPHDFGAHAQSLVFIHGSGGNSNVWAYQYAELHRRYNLVAVNLLGHGESEGEGETDIERYVSQVKAILEVLGLRRPILIGHSMGAAIVLSFAASYPEAVSGIVSVGGSATLPVNADILDGLIKNPDIALDLICKFSLAKENRPRLYDAIRASMTKRGIGVLVGDMEACNKVDLTGRLKKIAVPALVVCGAQDKMTPPEASRALAGGLPSAQLAFLEGAGHMVMMEKPDEFNSVLTKFCEGIDQRGSCLS